MAVYSKELCNPVKCPDGDGPLQRLLSGCSNDDLPGVAGESPHRCSSSSWDRGPGQWRCWRLDAEQEERGGRSLASHRPGAAHWAHYSSQEIQRSRYFAVYTDTGLGGQISALDLEA